MEKKEREGEMRRRCGGRQRCEDVEVPETAMQRLWLSARGLAVVGMRLVEYGILALLFAHATVEVTARIGLFELARDARDELRDGAMAGRACGMLVAEGVALCVTVGVGWIGVTHAAIYLDGAFRDFALGDEGVERIRRWAEANDLPKKQGQRRVQGRSPRQDTETDDGSALPGFLRREVITVFRSPASALERLF